MVTGAPVGDLAAAQLGPDKASGLSRVRASTSPEAPVIEITASGDTPDDAADVANAVAQALIKFGVNYRSQTHVTLTLFAEAAPQSQPLSPNPPRDIAVGAAAGLLIGALTPLIAGMGSASTESPRTRKAIVGQTTGQAPSNIVAAPQERSVASPDRNGVLGPTPDSSTNSKPTGADAGYR